MKKIIPIMLAMAIVSAPAFAAKATWTGESEVVQTVTYKMARRCRYQYNGTYFWRLFKLNKSCPATVNVE